MNLHNFYAHIKEQLSDSPADSPELEAKRLIQAVTGLGSADFITDTDQELSNSDIEQINVYLERRVLGEPLSKILGVKEFWGLEFHVNEHVLDPRPDTETLIESVLKWALQNLPCPQAGEQDGTGAGFRILDLGTGTGCIPIALLSELPNATAVAVDISEEALNMARKNAEKHEMSSRIEFIQSDWFESVPEQDFDLIISNPPYIPESDIEGLSPEVKNHDPILALSGGENGLDDYKKIIFHLKNKLNGRNRAFLEIGFGQLLALTRLVDDSNLLLCDSEPDIAGIPRVVEISCGDK